MKQSLYAAASAGDLVGTSFFTPVDGTGATKKVTFAQLRTALLGQGTGFATTDKLNFGASPSTAAAINVDVTNYLNLGIRILSGARVLDIGADSSQAYIGAQSAHNLALLANNIIKWNVLTEAAGTSTLASASATARFVGGATITAFRNSANTADILSYTDAGVITAAGTLSVTGGITSSYSGSTYLLQNLTGTTGPLLIRLSNTGGDTLFGTESSVAGTWVTGSTAYSSLFGSAGARSLHLFTSDAVRLTIDSSGALTVTGATTLSSTLSVTGQSITVGGNTAALNEQAIINTAAGQNRDILFQTAGVDRWYVRVDSVAESGGNAGSNFSIFGRTDAGAFIGTALSIIRSSMAATFGGSLSVTGAAGINGKTAVANVAAPTAAGATYGATEQTLLNDIRTRLINFGIYT